MILDDIEYFERAGIEVLGNHVGEENVREFYLFDSGVVKHFDKLEEMRGEGEKVMLEFGCQIAADLGERHPFDPDYFGEYMVKKFSGHYHAGCYCEHDCCGHMFTANMNIFHQGSQAIWWDQNNKREELMNHRWTVIISNGVNI